MDIFCTECGKKQLKENQGAHSAPTSDAIQKPYTPATSESNHKIALGLGMIATICAALVILVVIGLSLIFRTSYIEVPNLVNLTEEAATQQIEESRLTVGEITEEYSRRVEAGLVISQSPRAGREVERGSAVDLTISLGEEPIDYTDLKLDEATDLVEDRAPSMTIVPDAIGLPLLDAVHLLEESFLMLGRVYEDYHEDIERGHVIDQSLRAGTSVEEVSYVDLTISLGARPISVNPFNTDVWGEDQIITLVLGDVSIDVPIPPWLNDVIYESRYDEDYEFVDGVYGFLPDRHRFYLVNRERDDLMTMIEVHLYHFDGYFGEVAEGELDFMVSFLRNLDSISSITDTTIFYQSSSELTAGVSSIEYSKIIDDHTFSGFELIKINYYNGIAIRTRLRFHTVNAPEGMCSEEFASAFGLWRYIDAGYIELD